MFYHDSETNRICHTSSIRVNARSRIAPIQTVISHPRMSSNAQRTHRSICKYYIKGSCRYGDSCRKRHSLPESLELVVHNIIISVHRIPYVWPDRQQYPEVPAKVFTPYSNAITYVLSESFNKLNVFLVEVSDSWKTFLRNGLLCQIPSSLNITLAHSVSTNTVNEQTVINTPLATHNIKLSTKKSSPSSKKPSPMPMTISFS